MPPGAADVGEGGGEDFEEGEDGEHFPGELVVHGLVHEAVTGAHDLRSAEPSDDPMRSPPRAGRKYCVQRGRARGAGGDIR